MGEWQFPADGGHMERPTGVYVQTMNMTEINARLKQNDLIIIPVGSTECHGAAQPLGEDTFLVSRMAEQVALKMGCSVAEPVWDGSHPYNHLGMPGTVVIPEDAFLANLRGIIAGFWNMGFRKQILLVPGDLVVLNAGEKAPGDGELIEVTRLSLDEAILTGESEPVNKQAISWRDGIPPENALVPQNQVFMGTTVVTGRAILRITKTGTKTELGQIAASLSEHVEEDTPLQVRLKAFSKILTYIVVAATLVILLVGLIMGREFFDMLRTSIILAIAAVPEGLLIAVTVILVLGMRKILKRNGLVKKLLAGETLGSVTVICTDKTGTLTEGRMRVNRSDLFDPERAWQTMVLCNNLEGPVYVALWEFAEKMNLGDPQDLFDNSQRLDEELFSWQRTRDDTTRRTCRDGCPAWS